MDKLTNRERFLRVMECQPVDRVPNHEMGMWGQTFDAWIEQGMPECVRDEYEWGPRGFLGGSQYFGFDKREYAGIMLDARPAYPDTTVEENERHRVFIDKEGTTRRGMKLHEAHGVRICMDTFIAFPADTPQKWREHKKHFDPHSSERYPKDWDEKVKTWANRDYPLVPNFNSQYAFGLYSWLRRCVGTENACLAFYDEPAFVEELLEFYTDFTIETMKTVVKEVQFDYFNIFEDMAGKGGPLVSPQLLKRFMMPHYKRLVEFLKSNGVAYVTMDSDGDITPLIPALIESGIDCLWPLEPAAGMDILAIRKEFGTDLRLWGGIDKLEIAKGKKEIEAELYKKIPPLIEQGGYIPHLDHHAQPDMPYENFLYYLELKKKLLEGK